jgi:hypothetical protein
MNPRTLKARCRGLQRMIQDAVFAALIATPSVPHSDEAWGLMKQVCEEHLARYGPPSGWKLVVTDEGNIAERITATFELEKR